MLPTVEATQSLDQRVATVKRKILIIVENAPLPLDPRVWKEAQSLSANGYAVTLLSPKAKNASKTHEVIEGIHVYRHPAAKEGKSVFDYFWEYSCALFWEFLYAGFIYWRHGFDVIQACNPPDDIFLIALPFKLLGVKYIFDHHDANPELYLAKGGKKSFLYKALARLEKWTYKFSDIVIATNDSYRRLAITRGGIDPADVFIVRNGPALGTFNPVPPKPALKHGKRYLVGYVGNMSVQDGLDILLSVAKYIKDQGRQDVHFTCVGGGSELPQLRKLVQEMNLGDMFNFTGRISDADLLDILSTADVCVNPDRPCEMNDISTMIKIMEYMSLGKPIVQFDSREGRVSSQEASLYANHQNPVADFATKVLWLLDNPEERKRRGRLGRERIEKELAWEYSIPNLLAAYDRAYAKRSRSQAVLSADSSKRPERTW
jgi:glycosyltransferase involved in cell wall biosynthesis